jgi:glycosyltransferase involved in cell wall biosynthesis
MFTKSENKSNINKTYVLVTPARNEEAFIEETIKSVIRQTNLPKKWVIVSDGSTDDTVRIINKYLKKHPWIELVRMSERKERNFARKVHAFNAGYDEVKNLDYDIIGNLDADISFDSDYFKYLLKKFIEYPELGVAGTPFREGDSQYDYRFSRKEHVSGACQLFRKECFESIGGFIPLEAGAIDLTAVVTARMRGWGTAKSNLLIALFKSGYGDYAMGVYPLWQFFRSLYQMTRKPIFAGGFFLLIGYMWAIISKAKKPVSREFVAFRKKEQLKWLSDYIKNFLNNLRSFLKIKIG